MSKIFKTEKEIREKLGECIIDNNVIERLDIKIIAHFGNVVCLDMLCDSCCPIPLYNSTGNIGYIIQKLIVLLGKEREDGIRLTELNETPIRIVVQGKSKFSGKIKAIGHYYKDHFVLIDDLMKVGLTENER